MFIRPFVFFRQPVQLELSIDGFTEQYNVFTAAGSPTAAVWVRLTLGPGAIVTSQDINIPALDTGVFPAGSRLTIILESGARISGKGGDAGDGGSIGGAGFPPNNVNGTPGEKGGDAITLKLDTTIENNGTIQGGGGGGGGGGRCAGGAGTLGGCGGGGGAGQFPGAAGLGGNGVATDGADGNPGTLSAGGAGGIHVTDATPRGGNGGNPGQAGQAGETGGHLCTGPEIGAGGGGGAAGLAVRLNLNTVTWAPMGTVLGAVS